MRARRMLARGRALAEDLMQSTCIIGPEKPGSTLNPDTVKYGPPEITPVYTGRCKVRFVSQVTTDIDAQSQLLVKQDAVLSIPVDGSEQVLVGHVARITANPADPGMIGKRFRIGGDNTQTLATARRFPVELISGG